MTVLIVDDSGVNRKMVLRLLPQAWRDNVLQASDGAEALERMKAKRPDLIVVDLNMPGMNGYQLLAALKELPDPPPAIVLSADIQPKARERVLALGARAFLPKPPSAEAVLHALQECLVPQS